MSKKTWIIIVLLLSAINVLLFWPGSFYFLNDDFVHIPLTVEGKFFQTNSIRPLHELLVKLDLFFYGKNAYGFHLTALTLHFIVCLLLYNLAFTIHTNWLNVDRIKATNIAFAATAIFLIYPQHSESLTWVLGRTPILSAVFFIPSLRFIFNKKISLLTCILGFILFSAALFTYEQSILLPAILFWLTFIEKDKNVSKQKLLYASFISLAAIVYIVARKIITADIVGSYEGGNFISVNWQHLIANSFRLITRLLLNPSSVNNYLVAVVISLGLLFFALYKNNKKILPNKSTILFFTGIIILLIVPVISLGITIRSYESGRYMYLPSIFLAIALGMFLNGYAVIKPSPTYIFMIVLFCYWGWGKYQSANEYKQASKYVLQTQQKIFNTLDNTQKPVLVDTLRVTINRIPVFRMGFKTGLKWIYPIIDTSKIEVKYYYDEFTDPTLK